MLTWAAFPFLRIAAAFIRGITAYLYLGQEWAGSAAPWVTGAVVLYGLANNYTLELPVTVKVGAKRQVDAVVGKG